MINCDVKSYDISVESKVESHFGLWHLIFCVIGKYKHPKICNLLFQLEKLNLSASYLRHTVGCHGTFTLQWQVTVYGRL